MSDLSPKTRSLLSAARRDLDPSAGAHDRVWAGLVAADLPVTGDAPHPTSAPPPPATALLATAKPIALLLAAAALVGTGGWLARGPSGDRLGASSPASTHAAHRAVSPVLEPSPQHATPDRVDAQRLAVTVDPSRLGPTPVPMPAAASTRPARRPAAPSALDLELRLLRTATDALAAHAPAVALRALDTHSRRFPHGILREEREASRVIALCELGRLDEASLAEANVRPGSPYASRIARACTPRDGDSTDSDDGSPRRR